MVAAIKAKAEDADRRANNRFPMKVGAKVNGEHYASRAAPKATDNNGPNELVIPKDKRLSLLELTERNCKWPIGDPRDPDFHFCGQHKELTASYCEFHTRRAIRVLP